MPVFHLQTNVPKSKIPADFLQKTTAVMSQILGKPQSENEDDEHCSDGLHIHVWLGGVVSLQENNGQEEHWEIRGFKYCIAIVEPDALMMSGTSPDPCGVAQFGCIGRMGVEENKKLSAALFEHVEKSVGIPKDKMYITFIDLDAANVGYKGTTFHEIFKTDTSAK